MTPVTLPEPMPRRGRPLGARNLHPTLRSRVACAQRIMGLVKQGAVHGRAELLSLISPREMQIWRGVVHGETNKEIAGRLGVSPKTIAATREHLMEKLAARSVVDVVLHGVRFGIVTVEVLP